MKLEPSAENSDSPVVPTKKVRVVGLDHIPPRMRQRLPDGTADYASFRNPDSGQDSAFVHHRVFTALAEDGTASLPNETVGLLYGRCWQDGDGRWLLINRYVPAEPDEKECSPGMSSLTAEGNARLRRRTEVSFPAEENVGWAHSHTYDEPQFSGGDKREQAAKSVESFGLLAYLGGSGQWGFTAYLGPTATQLDGDPPMLRRARGRPASLAETSSVIEVRKPSTSRSNQTASVNRGSVHDEPPRPRHVSTSERPAQPRYTAALATALAVAVTSLGLVGDQRGWWDGRPFVAGIVAMVACGLIVLAAYILLVDRQLWTRSLQPPDEGRAVRQHADRPSAPQTGPAEQHQVASPLTRVRQAYGRMNQSILRTLGAAALLVALAVTVVFGPFAIGFQSAPATAPTNGQPSSVDAARSAEREEQEAQAAAEALATYDSYREAEIAALTNVRAPIDIQRYTDQPLLGTLAERIAQMRTSNIVYNGRPTWSAQVVTTNLAVQPGTVTIEDCFDSINWRPVNAATGKPIPSQEPGQRQRVTATAVRVGEHAWRITHAQPSQRGC